MNNDHLPASKSRKLLMGNKKSTLPGLNKTGALVWGQKKVQHVVQKISVVCIVLDMESLDNNYRK